MTNRLTDRKNADIIRAAIDEFQVNGYENTSMDRIAEVANVSKRTVYNHFPTKEALFERIVDELLIRAKLTIQFPFDSAVPIRDQLCEIGRTLMEPMMDPDFIAHTRIVLSRLLNQPNNPDFADRTEQMHANLISWLKKGDKSKQLKVKNPKLAARQFIALFKEQAFWPMVFGVKTKFSRREREELIQSSVDLFLAQYSR